AVAVPQIARVAFDDLALLGHGDLQEGLAVVHGPAGVGDQAVRGAVARVHVRVDEAGSDELIRGLDRAVDPPFEALTDVQDPVALEDDLAVPVEGMPALVVADDPGCRDSRAHGLRPASLLIPRRRQPRASSGSRARRRRSAAPPR